MTKHDDNNNSKNPHSIDEGKKLGVDFQNPVIFNALKDGKTVAEAKAIYDAAEKNSTGKGGEVKSTGGSIVSDPVRDGSRELNDKGVEPTEAEIATGARKPVGEKTQSTTKPKGK